MIGDKIRYYRKTIGFTLKQVSDGTTLSTSYLSQLERNCMEPSLSSLRKISAFLNVPIMLFLEESEHEDTFVIRKNERVAVAFSDAAGSHEIMSPTPNADYTPAALLYSFSLNAKQFDCETFITHNHDEIVSIDTGSITIYTGNFSTILNTGDTMLIPKNTPHRYYNHTDLLVNGYVISAPCSLPSVGLSYSN